MGSHSVKTEAVSNVVYPPMEKDSFGPQSFPRLYKGRRNSLWCSLEEGKPWRGSTGPSAAGGTGKVGVFLSHAASLYSEVKTPRRKVAFLSAGEGFSMQGSYFIIRQ